MFYLHNIALGLKNKMHMGVKQAHNLLVLAFHLDLSMPGNQMGILPLHLVHNQTYIHHNNKQFHLNTLLDKQLLSLRKTYYPRTKHPMKYCPTMNLIRSLVSCN